MQFWGVFLVGLALLVQAPLANAADGGGGYFRKGRVQLDLHHAIAVPSAEDDGRIYVYLTPTPTPMRPLPGTTALRLTAT